MLVVRMEARSPHDSNSPQELASQGLFAQAAEQIDKIVTPSLTLRVLRAELEGHIVSAFAAREQAESLLSEQLALRDRATCMGLVGNAALKSGDLNAGLRAMNRGLESAALAGEALVEARLRDRFVSSLLHSVSAEAASAELSRLRQCAVRAGDARSLTAFHILAGSIGVRRGEYANASGHLEISRGLLQRFRNEWLRGRLAIVSTATAILQSDYAAAMRHIEEARNAARLSGSKEILIPAIGNLALLTLASRQFDKTRSLLDELSREVRNSGSISTLLNVHGHAMQVAIAEGKLEEAKAIEGAAAYVVSKSDPLALQQLWFAVDRARLCYARGEATAGLELALKILANIKRESDVDLWRRANLLAAEGLGRLNRACEGALHLLAVLKGPTHCPIEIVADLFRVEGRLVATENPEAARSYFSDAERILGGIGNLTGKDEVRRDARESLTTCAGEQTIGSVPSQFHHVDRVLAAFEVGAIPPLFAKELFAWVSSSALFESAMVIETPASGEPQTVEAFPITTRRGTDFNDLERIPIGTLGQSTYELLAKPKATVEARCALVSLERLSRAATSLARARQVERWAVPLWPGESPDSELGLVCNSKRTRDLLESIRQVANSNVTVLITGETGVGKELFARALHNCSQRSHDTFLPFNCSTVPREMIDSQLFGHKRGSFTGAVGDSPGVVRTADGGTLFLDEIGEMAIETQPKLLRFLESGEILPLGDTRPRNVDVRVVAATNANLDQLVADGRFREDLYYRLNVIRLEVPPLRERREEVPALVEHFMELYARDMGKPLLRMSDETLEYLVLYHWPGNVRQLGNEVRRLVAMAEPGGVIMPAHLSRDIADSRSTVPVNGSPRLFDEVVTRIDQPLSAAVEHIERAAIQRALSMTDGHLDEAARILGLSRKGLYLKRQRLNLG